MKKMLFFLILLSCIPLHIFAINGDGSYGSPFNGSLTANMNWSGTIYVNGDVTVSGYTLTISPGAIIVFLIPGSDLIITGTGVLTADGTNASMIRFTADSDNSGTFGGTGETWGHISFQNMTSGFTTSSIIDNCIIEFGQKNGSTFIDEARGGGINTTFTYVTITNSIIRNNYAGFGGGICVSSGAYPSISNCIITNNTAGKTGGGLLLDGNPLSRIDNCIIMKNTSTGDGGAGGVFVGDNSTDVRFYNCTIVSNISEIADRGDNIRLYNNFGTPKPRFYNTIVWGSNRSINTSGPNPASTDFNYCAIQGYTSGYTNCINLSETNNDPSGPNFYNITAGSEDYQIKFISPCRDAGTTPSPAIDYDYSGNPRVGPYDIGAYEVQYSRWKTTAASTDWGTSGNWEGDIPTNSKDVIIPTGASNYPTGSTSQDFTIGSGKQMIIEQGARVTLNSLTNNGILKLNHNSSGFASLIINNYTRGTGGSEDIQLYLTGGGTKTTYKWHYISTPVALLPVSTFAPGTTLDVAQYIESRPTLSLREGWVAYDGWIYSDQALGGPTFSNLTPGKGYDYWDNANNTFSFSGQLNTGNTAMSLGFSGDATLHGFNLLGNPFSSGLDWNDVVDGVYFTYPSNTSKGLYFTRDNVQCSYIAGVGIPSDVSGIIPSMQGFFIKTYSTGNTITLPAAARTHDNIHARYKGSSIIPLVRLSLTEDTLSDETVVRFDELAKSGFDYDFDALKMFLASDITTIHSASGGINYSINGQPFPVTTVEIPIVVNLITDTIHKITATQLQGLDNYNVTLTDNITGFTGDLKTTSELSFNSLPGNITDRFVLKITNISTGIEDLSVSKKSFVFYQSNGSIDIQTISDDWDGRVGSVKVIDMSGKAVTDLQNAEFRKSSFIQVQAPAVNGLYFVEIKSGLKRFVGKVVIK